MRQCSKQATGKKGAERKDFMKTCLSKKVKRVAGECGAGSIRRRRRA